MVRKDPGLQRLWSLLYLFSAILPPVITSPLGWAAAAWGWVVLVALGSRDSSRVTPGTTSPASLGRGKFAPNPRAIGHIGVGYRL